MKLPSIVGVVLGLALGGSLAFNGGRAIYRAWVCGRWPTAPAVVTSSQVQVSRSRRTAQHLPRVEYRYSVNGQEFASDVLSFSALGTDARTAQEWITRYPRGARVEVHYAPSDPRIACVYCGPPGWRDALAAVGGAALAIFSGASAVQAIRARTRPNSRWRASEASR